MGAVGKELEKLMSHSLYNWRSLQNIGPQTTKLYDISFQKTEILAYLLLTTYVKNMRETPYFLLCLLFGSNLVTKCCFPEHNVIYIYEIFSMYLNVCDSLHVASGFLTCIVI
jgi:hypothetical protein